LLVDLLIERYPFPVNAPRPIEDKIARFGRSQLLRKFGEKATENDKAEERQTQSFIRDSRLEARESEETNLRRTASCLEFRKAIATISRWKDGIGSPHSKRRPHETTTPRSYVSIYRIPTLEGGRGQSIPFFIIFTATSRSPWRKCPHIYSPVVAIKHRPARTFNGCRVRVFPVAHNTSSLMRNLRRQKVWIYARVRKSAPGSSVKMMPGRGSRGESQT